MEVKIQMISQSNPIERHKVKNCYTKDGFYCVYKDGLVEKFPMVNIFKVVETYE